MSSRKPPAWRRVVNTVDGVVTPPANALVRTNAFADAVGTALRVEARVRRGFEQQTGWFLHSWNLPTAVDVRRMQAQLAALEGRMRDLSERLDDLDRSGK